MTVVDVYRRARENNVEVPQHIDYGSRARAFRWALEARLVTPEEYERARVLAGPLWNYAGD